MAKKRPEHPLTIGTRVRSKRSPSFNSRWYWHGTGTVLYADRWMIEHGLDWNARLLVIKDGHLRRDERGCQADEPLVSGVSLRWAVVEDQIANPEHIDAVAHSLRHDGCPDDCFAVRSIYLDDPPAVRARFKAEGLKAVAKVSS